jgi:hypothetical protein
LAALEVTMRSHDFRTSEILRHGAYLCFRVPASERRELATRGDVAALAARVGLRDQFVPDGDAAAGTFALLRRIDAAPADIADDELLRADAVVHVEAQSRAPVEQFCAALARLLGPAIAPRILRGVVRPFRYTGDAMHNFAYAERVLPQAGTVAPHAFVVPLSKTERWWAMGWMERHTYFLPRYDDEGRMLSAGHALAAADGIACLMRRTYRHEDERAPDGGYDFVTYFECADADVPTFHAVLAALRDTTRNPEWRFVREGPTWHGRRVATWAELFV